MRPLMLAAAAALALTGISSFNSSASAQGGRMRADAMTPTMRAPYVQLASASDLYEIRSGQLALQKSRNPQVRRFAQMLVRDHTNTTRQLMAAARASGMRPLRPALMPMQARMMRELNNVQRVNFDRVFLNQQVQAHQMALALHSNYAQRGDTPALRSVAAAAAPVVQMHLTEVQRWAGR
jgi:putative membrane protein